MTDFAPPSRFPSDRAADQVVIDAATLERLAAPGTVWSVRIDELAPPRRALGGIGTAATRTLLAHDADRIMSTASIGKILLLVAVAADIERGRLDPDAPVDLTPADAVADSGLLRFLRGRHTVADLAVLVGAVSDNLATNVLLRLVGLDRVARLAAASGVTGVHLHDRVRDERTSEHPPALSTASTDGLVELLVALHRGTLVSPAVSRHVVDWLCLDTDTSMVAGALGLDPLCHSEIDRGLILWHKTGTQTGLRADTGVVVGGRCAVAYAAVARWEADDAGDPRRDEVLATMRALGEVVRDAASGAR